MDKLNPSLRKKVALWLEENAKQTVYRSDAASIHARLESLGATIYSVLVRVKVKDGLLKKVFDEQYAVGKGRESVRDKRTIAAGSVQPPPTPPTLSTCRKETKR